MDIPDLVQQALEDEEIQAGISLGEEDTVCFTPTRTLVYRGEGLLSDEKVESYPYDFERLTISEGRRKTKFTLVYTDEKREFGVPGTSTDAVLEQLLNGALRSANTIDTEEQVTGVFRFSELTLVITEGRVLKHLGSVTWDNDFELYPFGSVTGLEFEEGSVATSIVLSVNDRPERIKAPSDQAPTVRKTLEKALFAFYGVSSLDELNATVSVGPDDPTEEDGSELGLEGDIDPLVSDETESEEATEPAPSTSASSQTVAPSADTTDERGDIAALEQQVAELTAAIEQQNQRLEAQEATIKTLIEELRQGR